MHALVASFRSLVLGVIGLNGNSCHTQRLATAAGYVSGAVRSSSSIVAAVRLAAVCQLRHGIAHAAMVAMRSLLRRLTRTQVVVPAAGENGRFAVRTTPASALVYVQLCPWQNRGTALTSFPTRRRPVTGLLGISRIVNWALGWSGRCAQPSATVDNVPACGTSRKKRPTGGEIARLLCRRSLHAVRNVAFLPMPATAKPEFGATGVNARTRTTTRRFSVPTMLGLRTTILTQRSEFAIVP